LLDGKKPTSSHNQMGSATSSYMLYFALKGNPFFLFAASVFSRKKNPLQNAAPMPGKSITSKMSESKSTTSSRKKKHPKFLSKNIRNLMSYELDPLELGQMLS